MSYSGDCQINASDFSRLLPATSWWPLIDRGTLAADAWAALTAALLVLPQAIAFSAIAGLPIEFGFYTAMVTPVVAALFGSSRHMISGPTTAISILLFASLSQRFEVGSPAFIQAALTLTLLAGLFQLLMGLLRLGNLASFVSPSVMVGFTGGAAAMIVISQAPSILGLPLDMLSLVAQDSTLACITDVSRYYTMSIATVAVVVAVAVHRYAPRLPNYLCALLVGTVMAFVLDADQQAMAYVGSTGGFAFSVLPPLAWPAFNLELLRELAQSAFALSLVGLLEAAAISRSLATKTGQDIDINQEFFGQGLSNVVASFFSAYMGSGSFTRSAANHAAGAKTPLAAVFASVILFFILLFVRDWMVYIPVPAIGGIIVVVAFRLIEFEHIGHIIKTSPAATAVMSVTFGATLLLGLEFGICFGVFVSLMLFLRRSASPYLAMTAPDTSSDGRYFRNAPAFGLDECPQMGFGRLDGLLYFGSIEEIRRQLRRIEMERPEQSHLVLLMKGVGDIDMPGAELIIEETRRRRSRGGELYLTARERQINGPLRQYNVIAAVGKEQIFPTKHDAIETIVPRLYQNICAGCDKRVFRECPAAPAAKLVP